MEEVSKLAGGETVAGCRAVFGSDRGGARLGRSVRASPKGMVRKTGKIENNSSKHWSGYCMLGSVAIFLHRLLYLILRIDFSSTIIVPTYRYGNGRSERLSHLPKVAELISYGAEI